MCAWITDLLQNCYKVPKNVEKARGCGLFREKRREKAWLCGLWDVTTLVTPYWSGKVRRSHHSNKIRIENGSESPYM